MTHFSRILRNTSFSAGLTALLAVVLAGSVVAQSRDERIAERLKPVGEVCLAGEPCTRGRVGAAGSLVVATDTVASAAAADAGVPAGFNVQQTYAQSCAMCHNTGMAGAPKLGDAAFWASRIEEKTMAVIVQNAITGVNAMPPRGMCMTCSDENIAALVEHLATATE